MPISEELSPLKQATSRDKTWGLSLEPTNPAVVGPVRAFSHFEPDVAVSVIDPSAIPPLDVCGSLEVQESKKSFTVDQLKGDGIGGVRHHGSGNTVLWSNDGCDYFISASPSWETTWTHVRFILRNIFIARSIRDAMRNSIHAVVATMPGQSGGVAIVGPTLSGKSRLMNQLLMRRVLDTCIEDDCPLINPDGSITSLIPTQHEVRHQKRMALVGLIILNEEYDRPSTIPVEEAAALAAAYQVPWPAKWLPDHAPRPGTLPFAASLNAMALPTKCDSDESTVNAVASFVESLTVVRASI